MKTLSSSIVCFIFCFLLSFSTNILAQSSTLSPDEGDDYEPLSGYGFWSTKSASIDESGEYWQRVRSAAVYFGAGGPMAEVSAHTSHAGCSPAPSDAYRICSFPVLWDMVIGTSAGANARSSLMIVRKDGTPVPTNISIPVNVTYAFSVHGTRDGNGSLYASASCDVGYSGFNKGSAYDVYCVPSSGCTPGSGSGTLSFDLPGQYASSIFIGVSVAVSVTAVGCKDNCMKNEDIVSSSSEAQAIADPYLYIDPTWPQVNEYQVLVLVDAATNTWVPHINTMFLLNNGKIEGHILNNSMGFGDVIVELYDNNSNYIGETITDGDGYYTFADLSSGEYSVSIINPLGFNVDLNPKPATVTSGNTTIIDFNLTELVVSNEAMGMGYWKHQFNVYVTGNGTAQETENDLNTYIETIHQHYSIHYNIYQGEINISDWYDLFNLKGNIPMSWKAEKHLAALLFNLASSKISQSMIVTEDARTAGDVIDYVSALILDGDQSNDELAKNLAENVNEHQIISSGIVPVGSTLFKSSLDKKDMLSYELFDNYPNPFNPITKIKYQIPNTENVNIRVYDILGKEVALLVNDKMEAGNYEVLFDATNMSSGIYYYQLQAGSYVETKKMILLK